MPADLQKARELFLHAVGKLPLEEWDDYVDQSCGGNVELKQQVGHLLQAHREAGSFLDQPVVPSLATGAFSPPPDDEAVVVSLRECPGTMIAGKYKLVEILGEGGMGSVWRARQTAPVKRLVAVKLIKAGMDSKQVLARFEAERQALALMDHSNIAKVLDGGLHNNRPYFVMELVKGVPITEYSDHHKLTPKERLELFVPVCQAIQHAPPEGNHPPGHQAFKRSDRLIRRQAGGESDRFRGGEGNRRDAHRPDYRHRVWRGGNATIHVP